MSRETCAILHSAPFLPYRLNAPTFRSNDNVTCREIAATTRLDQDDSASVCSSLVTADDAKRTLDSLMTPSVVWKKWKEEIKKIANFNPRVLSSKVVSRITVPLTFPLFLITSSSRIHSTATANQHQARWTEEELSLTNSLGRTMRRSWSSIRPVLYSASSHRSVLFKSKKSPAQPGWMISHRKLSSTPRVTQQKSPRMSCRS
mmetsp:Transcript_20463/g.33915  ORF Transcript_20463/g.33915 Transcript_20463/m.33915 type:complete len:203 (+) Transcript_20463:466-1074(+)